MAQVVAQQNIFARHQTQIVQISFGTAYWAAVWQAETQSPFPLLLDQTQESYAAFGLARSFWQSWGAKNLFYYAKAITQGEKPAGYRGDTNQLGDDFIVDARGVIQFAHPSKEPTDRPDISYLLKVISNF